MNLVVCNIGSLKEIDLRPCQAEYPFNVSFFVGNRMEDLFQLLKKRKDFVSQVSKQVCDCEGVTNQDVIAEFGFATFQEIESHRNGQPLVSTYFHHIYGVSPKNKAESVRHGRALRKLAQENKIKLFCKNDKSSQVRWASIVEPKDR